MKLVGKEKLSYYFQLILIFFVIINFVGCGMEKGKWRVSGEMEDMQAGELWIYCLTDEVEHHDTIHVEGNHFTYTGTIGEDIVPYLIVYPNATEHVVFAESGKMLDYSVVAHDLRNYKVTGSKTNKIMNSFREETAEIPDIKRLQGVAKQYIKKYAESPVATYLLDRYFIQEMGTNDTQKLSEISTLLNLIEEAQPGNDYVKTIRGKIHRINKNKKGNVLPKQTLTSLTNEKIELQKIKNKHILLCFWATWMDNPVYHINKMKAFKEKYAQKNDIRVLTVTLDGSRYQWRNFLADDSTTLTNCYDGLSWDSPLVKQLGIPSVPYYVLTDKNKKITASNSNLDALQDGLEPTTP